MTRLYYRLLAEIILKRMNVRFLSDPDEQREDKFVHQQIPGNFIPIRLTGNAYNVYPLREGTADDTFACIVDNSIELVGQPNTVTCLERARTSLAVFSSVRKRVFRSYSGWCVAEAPAINPFGNTIRERCVFYVSVSTLTRPSPWCLVHPGQLITIGGVGIGGGYIAVVGPEDGLRSATADHSARVCSGFPPNYGNTQLYEALPR